MAERELEGWEELSSEYIDLCSGVALRRGFGAKWLMKVESALEIVGAGRGDSEWRLVVAIEWLGLAGSI